MNKARKIISLYTLIHFAIDFTTIFLVYRILLGPAIGIVNRANAVIVYNLVAFAGQLPIGIICDVFKNKPRVVAVGCLLAGLAYPVALIMPWVACVMAALGNAIFHIGAGSDVLDLTMPKAGASGVFVSSGAIGVWLAYKAQIGFFIWVFPVLMLFFAAVMLLVPLHNENSEKNINLKFNIPSYITMLSGTCFMITIVFRSLLGMVMNFPWKAVPVWGILYTAAVVFGKASGGYISDKIGWLKTAMLSLASAFVLFIFSFTYPVCGVLAVFFFNMTMPLTLTAIASFCDKKYGFAFGLTTFALAIGYVPLTFGADGWFGMSLLLTSVASSFILMVLGYYLMNLKRKRK